MVHAHYFVSGRDVGIQYTYAYVEHSEPIDFQAPPSYGSGRYGFGVLGAKDSVLRDRCSVGRRHAFFDHFSKHLRLLNSVLGGQSSVSRSGIPCPQNPKSSTTKTTIWHCLRFELDTHASPLSHELIHRMPNASTHGHEQFLVDKIQTQYEYIYVKKSLRIRDGFYSHLDGVPRKYWQFCSLSRLVEAFLKVSGIVFKVSLTSLTRGTTVLLSWPSKCCSHG